MIARHGTAVACAVSILALGTLGVSSALCLASDARDLVQRLPIVALPLTGAFLVARNVDLATPGASTVEDASLPFRHLPRPLWPLDRDFQWSADAAT